MRRHSVSRVSPFQESVRSLSAKVGYAPRAVWKHRACCLRGSLFSCSREKATRIIFYYIHHASPTFTRARNERYLRVLHRSASVTDQITPVAFGWDLLKKICSSKPRSTILIVYMIAGHYSNGTNYDCCAHSRRSNRFLREDTF